MPIVNLIAAIGKQRQIGLDQKLPWKVRGDLQSFRELTLGHTLIMGRKTFESIGRPLPGRANIVLSRSSFNAPGCKVVPSFEAALAAAQEDGASQVFVIGGEAVFAAALPIAARVYLSRIPYDGPGDAFFPPFPTASWQLQTAHTHHAVNGDPEWALETWTNLDPI